MSAAGLTHLRSLCWRRFHLGKVGWVQDGLPSIFWGHDFFVARSDFFFLILFIVNFFPRWRCCCIFPLGSWDMGMYLYIYIIIYVCWSDQSENIWKFTDWRLQRGMCLQDPVGSPRDLVAPLQRSWKMSLFSECHSPSMQAQNHERPLSKVQEFRIWYGSLNFCSTISFSSVSRGCLQTRIIHVTGVRCKLVTHI